MRTTRVAVVLLIIATAVLGCVSAYAAATLPSIDDLSSRTGTMKILDAHGQLIAELNNSEGPLRHTVHVDEVAPIMQEATVGTEDRAFYSEGSIDAQRVAKALLVDVVAGRPEQGASTITQQLAKLAFLPGDKTPLRKLRQVLLAGQIDARYTKRQILEMYLNILYYGHGAYGVEDAARVYFNTSAAHLDLREASLLAGLPQAPSLDDPFENPQAAFARQHIVLRSLVATRVITDDQANAIDPGYGDATTMQRTQAVTLQLLRRSPPQQQATSRAPHFVQFVRNELAQRFGSDSAVFTRDITVTTSLDLVDQQRAEASVAGGVARLAAQGANNGALLMLDVRPGHEGEIRAMVGSAGYTDAAIDGQFNVVTAQRRPGSSFKPFVYEQAFRSGVLSPSSMLDDTRDESARLGGVQDFDGRFDGRVTASRALLTSRNVPAEQAMLATGISDTIAFAHQLGITSPLADNASTAIGSSAVRMIDEASAYGAFADGGMPLTAHAVTRVTDGGGAVLFEQSGGALGPRAMTAREAAAVTTILRGYDRHWGVAIRRPAASKSGTTDNFVDAWYMTYTPDMVVGTWAGRTDAGAQGEQGMRAVYGTDVGKAIAVPFINGSTLPAPDFSIDLGGGWSAGRPDQTCDTLLGLLCGARGTGGQDGATQTSNGGKWYGYGGITGGG